MKIYEKNLSQAIEKDFKLKIFDIHKIDEGVTNVVYKGILNGKEVFIRMDQGKKIFPVETYVYATLAEHSIPVPKVIAYKEKPESVGSPTMILSKVEGSSINNSSDDEKQNLFKKAGEMFKRIHKIAVLGFGTLKLKNNELKGKSKKWSEVWNNHLNIPQEIKYLSKNKLITEDEKRFIESELNDILQLDIEKASLLHADYQSAHIFTDGKEITGIIDLGSVFAGDPRYDIANSLLFFEPEFHESFRSGYGDLASDPVIEKYMTLICAYKAGWRHRKGRIEYANKSLEKLREIYNKSR